MKRVLLSFLLVAMLSAQGCNALVSAVMYPRAGKFLRHSDVEAVFGIPMTLVDDSPRQVSSECQFVPVQGQHK